MTVIGAVPPMIVDGIAETDGNYGPQGPQGVPGPIGPTGPTGDTGPQGIQGPIGPQGIQGPVGPIGPEGPQGVKGDTGAQGPVGPEGAGIDIQGTVPHAPDDLPPTGEPGDAWMSADDGHMWAWDDDTNTWIDLGKVQGPAGPQGPIGETGATGATGATGPEGPKGDTGDQGAQGIQGIQGPIGLTGPEGPTGPQGPQGEQGLSGVGVAHAVSHASGGADEILNINATRITSGILPDARLSALVAFKNINNNFSSGQDIADAVIVKGPAAALYLKANASPLNKRVWRLSNFGDAAGTLNLQALSDDNATSFANFYFLQNGEFHTTTLVATNINASSLTSGVVPDARLSGNVAMRNAYNTFTGSVQQITAPLPTWRLYDTSGAVDQKQFENYVSGGQLVWRSLNDAYTVVYGHMRLDRARNFDVSGSGTFPGGLGTTPINPANITAPIPDAKLSANVAYKTVDNNFVPQTFADQSVISGPNSWLNFYSTAAPAGLKRWRLLTYAEGAMHFESMSDDNTVANGRVSFLQGSQFAAPGGLPNTPLNATNLTSGTVPDARLDG